MAQDNAERIARAVQRAAGKGLRAAALFLVGRLKETLNVPAPRKRVVSGAGDLGYRATTPATPGAPPRKVSGMLQRSVAAVERPGGVAIVVSAKGPGGFGYPRYHEVREPGRPGSGRHPFARVTAEKYRRELATILGQALRLEVGK